MRFGEKKGGPGDLDALLGSLEALQISCLCERAYEARLALIWLLNWGGGGDFERWR
jgi:hypothetical protein